MVDAIMAGQGANWRLLEVLAVYMMRTILQFSIVPKSLVRGGQVDVLVRNVGSPGRPLRWIGDYFLIECKNLNETVDEKEFGHFLSKMTLNGSKEGAIISNLGLSGSPAQYASRDQKQAYFQLGVVVLDIRLAELRQLSSAESFLQLLQNRYEDLRFSD